MREILQAENDVEPADLLSCAFPEVIPFRSGSVAEDVLKMRLQFIFLNGLTIVDTLNIQFCMRQAVKQVIPGNVAQKGRISGFK